MGAKGGHDAKDKVLVDGFNPIKELTPAQQKVRANALNALAIAHKNTAERKRLAKEEAARRAAAVEAARAAGVYVDPMPEIAEEEILESVLFQDMRAIYKKLKGREKLEKWAKDDKNFMTLVKELMKQESAVLAAKIRKGEGEINGGSQSFFVVLKGLEEEKGLAEKFDDKTVDMKQVKHVLEPEAGPYEAERPAVEEAQRADTPVGW